MGLLAFVTGAAGFIGSHLTERLLERGWEVVGFDNLSSGKRSNLAEALENPRFRLVENDLSNRQAIEEELGECTHLYHLAADPEVKRGAEEPEEQLKQNLLTTFNLLEAVRMRARRTRLVLASTSTVYGEASQIPTSEHYGPLMPISMYGATKLACEALASAYTQLLPLQVVVFRFANVVGSRAGHGVIVDFIRKLKTNPSELEVLGDGTQSKSYLHISDCVNAFLLWSGQGLIEPGVQIFNIGTEQRTNVLEIAEMVIRSMNLSGVRVRMVPGPDGRGWKGDVKEMQVDIRKVRERGWQPSMTSTDAVSRAVDELLAGRGSI